MLYLIHMRNQDLTYKGGQSAIIHLEADLHATVNWATTNHRRWAFTLSNAGSRYFEDRADLVQLNEINWTAVAATQWSSCKEEKQAEFLIEQDFPWHLVERIGVQTNVIASQVMQTLPVNGHRPNVQVLPQWYY